MLITPPSRKIQKPFLTTRRTDQIPAIHTKTTTSVGIFGWDILDRKDTAARRHNHDGSNANQISRSF
ncbi:hypothetical protein PM082_007560 [Marasmius tenuissimus]|nr:hypothetical protein PM082_007560 [Marasmius tenuissimus]